jgi:hypothetical protein
MTRIDGDFHARFYYSFESSGSPPSEYHGGVKQLRSERLEGNRDSLYRLGRRGSYRISPLEVESVLVEHPSVAESAVICAQSQTLRCNSYILRSLYRRLPSLARVRLNSTGPTRLSKTLGISERKGDTVAESIKEIVFPLAFFVTDSKAFDLVRQMVSGFPLVDGGLVKCVNGIFDVAPENIAGH